MSATPCLSLNTCSSVRDSSPFAFFSREGSPYREGGLSPSPGRAGRCRKPVDSTPQGLFCPKGSCSRPHLCSWGAQEAREEQARGPPPHRVSPLLEGSSSVQTRKVTNSGSLHPLSPIGSHLLNPACHKVGGWGAFGHSTSLCCREGKSHREAWDPGNLGSWKFKRAPVG